ncbi:MAG: segregation/condensation protein A [Patescibacteria group bacterium]
MYKVQLEKFEGPLDLLLELIESEKLNITEVSLTKVCDQYLKYLEETKDISPSNLADFLLVAAQLILIKSKAILPDFQLSDEEKISTEELSFRLLQYKKFKAAAKKILQMYLGKNICHEKRFQETLVAFYPGKNLTSENISLTFYDLLRILKQFEILEKETIKETVSIKEKIIHLQFLISRQVNIRFNKIIKQAKTRLEAIVSFLALLELIRQKVINVIQSDTFGEIEIKKSSNQEL